MIERKNNDTELDVPHDCSICDEAGVELVTPTVLFPWVVITVPLGKTHSIETGRDNPGIVFTMHDKVK